MADSNRVNGNNFEPGSAGVYSNGGTKTELNGETDLSGLLSQTTGSITLFDDITNYQRVQVTTGTAGANFVTDESRGWHLTGFRVGTDYINVRTKNGSASMAITSSTLLSIQGIAPDAVRFITGMGRVK